MKKKLNSEQQQEHVLEQQSGQKAGVEFATVEEVLRFDAAQTTVPPEVERRLQRSSGDCPKPGRSWWRRLLGGRDE